MLCGEGLGATEISKQMKIGRSTVYKILRKYLYLKLLFKNCPRKGRYFLESMLLILAKLLTETH